MAKTREQKKDILAIYEDYLKKAKAIYLASTRLSANEASDIKKKLNSDKASYSVVKNTLFTLATKNVIGESLTLEGQHAAVFCLEDVVEPAKSLAGLKKEDKAKYVLCIYEGKVLDSSKIENIANLESKEQLLGKFMYLVNYPTTGFARVLSNNIERLAYALNAVKDAKGA
jgi:large subunit ribosomal protein L10